MKPTAIEWVSYTSWALHGKALAPAPLLPLVLESAGRSWAGAGIVDSGSELSCIPREVAAHLALDLQGPVREIDVFGGGVVRVETTVCDLRIPRAPSALVFRGAEFAVPETETGEGLLVLGRTPLFGEVEVRFQGWLGRFGLQRRFAGLSFVPSGGTPPRPSARSSSKPRAAGRPRARHGRHPGPRRAVRRPGHRRPAPAGGSLRP